MLTVVDRGADILQAAGQLGGDTAAALKAEAAGAWQPGPSSGTSPTPASPPERPPEPQRPWSGRAASVIVDLLDAGPLEHRAMGPATLRSWSRPPPWIACA
jgi:hypothetical protein